MGVETALLIAGGVAAGAGAIGSVMSGNAANREAQAAANLEAMNSEIARQETSEEMRVQTEEMTRLKETQKLAMLHSGMSLAGSPLLILEDTKRQLALELNSLQYKSSVDTYASNLKQQNYLASGRAAMIGGYVKGVESLASFGLGGKNKTTSKKDSGYTFKTYGDKSTGNTDSGLFAYKSGIRQNSGLFYESTF